MTEIHEVLQELVTHHGIPGAAIDKVTYAVLKGYCAKLTNVTVF